MRVSVIGGSRVDEETYGRAGEVGRLLAERGHTVVCGGYGGVMEAACRGAVETRESEDAPDRAADALATGNLDRDTGDRILELFEELRAEEGVAVVTVTHDDYVAEAADRVVDLVDGELRADDATARADGGGEP